MENILYRSIRRVQSVYISTVVMLAVVFSGTPGISAQIMNQSPYGPGRVATTPSMAETQRTEEPKTAEEIVDESMPDFTEALELNDFEQAVFRSVMLKYVKKRMELTILQLEREQAQEAYEKISKEEDEEMKLSLSEEKYAAFRELRTLGPDWKRKMAREKKKKEKNKKKNRSKNDSEDQEY